jgi:hemoglobin/transferrin/lactoferrin receptor protein
MVGSGRGVRTSAGGISIVALVIAAGLSPAQAQERLDPLTVLATRTIEATINALAMVSSVRQEQLDRIQPQRGSDMFWGMPSVWFRERGDSPETAINIRGLQDFGRVAVVIDGARQNFQRSGHNANGTFFVEPETIAEVDVSRGPVSNIYGSGAIGGVVSMRTKDVQDVLRPHEKAGALMNFNLGSNERRGLGSFFGAARPNENIDIFAGGTYRSQADYKDGNGNVVPFSANDTGTALGKLTVRPAEGHEVKLGASTLDSRYKTGQTSSQESVMNTRVKNDTATLRYRYSKPEDYLFNFDGNVYWNNTRQDQTKIQNGTAGSMGNPITGFVGDSRFFNIETQGFDVNNTSRFDVGEFRNFFTIGGDYFKDDVESFDPRGTGDVLTPGGVRTVSGAFAQWKGQYRWLEVIGALRYDNYKLESLTTSASGDRISPKLTVGVTPINGFTLYGTYAEGYRAPAVTETLVQGAHASFLTGNNTPLFTFLPNPNLRPEVGHTMEAGANFKYDDVWAKGDKLRVKVNAFQNDVDDYIELVNFGPPVIAQFCPAPFPGCPPVPTIPIPINTFSLSQYQNIGSARLRGIEFEGTYDAGDWFVGLSGQHIRGRDTTNNIPLLTVQPDQLAATFGVRVLERKLTMAVRWQAVAAKTADQIPDRDGNGLPDFLPTSAYNLVNLYVGYQPTPDVLASFSIDNLFNQYYVQYMNAEGQNPPGSQSPPPYVFPGSGITFKGGLKLRFGA